MPGAMGNTAPRRNDISSDLDASNILNTSRRRNRHTAHAAALQQVGNLSGYHAAFGSALRTITTPTSVRFHRDSLPPEPKSWKQMLVHPHSTHFKLAADREFNTLYAKETFEYIEQTTTTDDRPLPLPLTWVFKYKFDSDGY